MNLATLAVKNVFRNRLRTFLTILGVAVAVMTFVLLRTVVSAWTVAAEYAAKDRIATRHKVTFILSLPKRYIDDIRGIAEVKAATFASWFGGKDPRHEREFFATLAVDAPSVLDVYDEIVLTPGEKENWLKDRSGAIVGDVLAKKLGWKVGDKISIASAIYQGDWQFQIDGIYTATRKSVDRSTFFFHWDYLNETIPERRRDEIGWVISRIDEPARSADISAAIDRMFDERDVQTITMSERAMNTSFMAMFSAVLKAIDIISLVILIIMTLILGNTIAMGVRERTNEYGVLRAMGFLPRHVGLFILGEAVTVGALGGALGLALAYPLINNGIGRWLEENLGAMFPYFRVDNATAVLAVVAAMFLGAASALIPAGRAYRLRVVDALRRIG